MLTAYTRETPARPTLGIVTAAAALVLGLAAAGLLTRQRGATLPMQPRMRLPDWPVTFAVPVGWKPGAATVADANTTYADQEVFDRITSDGKPARLTVGFRSLEAGTLAHDAAELEAVAYLKADAEDRDARAAAQAVGPLFGLMVQVQVMTGGGISHVAIITACLPNGRMLFIRLEGGGALSHESLAALRTVCASVELTGAAAASAPDASGLACDAPPDGMQVVARGDIPPAALQFTATAQADFAWHVHVQPTFLSTGRTPEDLLADFLVSAEGTPQPQTSMQADSWGTAPPHAGVKASMTAGSNVLDVRVVDLGESRAALIIGHADVEHRDAINLRCARIAATLRVNAAQWPFDVPAAVAAGERVMAKIREDGISKLLPPKSRTARWILDQAGRPAGDDVAKWSRPGGDGEHAGSHTVRRFAAGRLAYALTRDWALRSDGAIAHCTEEIRRARGQSGSVKTEQEQSSADGQLTYRVTTSNNSHEATFVPPANFLPDPLLEHVAHALTTQSDSEAVFRSVSLSIRGLAATHMRVVRKSGDTDGGGAVVVISDFAPSPSMYHFDDRGQVTRIDYANWRTLRKPRRGEQSMTTNLLDALRDDN